MTIDLREWLYPLGFLASIAFGGRMLLQWTVSEYQKKSVVTRKFWYLSLFGNIMLTIHALIQIQFHVCLVQACNAVISWRNIDLMKTSGKPMRFFVVIGMLAVTLGLVTLSFVLQGYLLGDGSVTWFRIPTTPWSEPEAQNVPAFVHGIGFLGIVLFSSRFWVQWWMAEAKRKSYLGTTFWMLSLIGTLFSLFYFVHIKDPVNYIGPALGTIPYLRNLMLIRKTAPEGG